MMQSVDDATLRATPSIGTPAPAQRSPRPLRADDDPFAHIPVEVPDGPDDPPPSTKPAGLPSPAAREMPAAAAPARERGPPPPERRSVRTATSMSPLIVHGEVTSSRALPRMHSSLASVVASWALVVVAGVAAAGGVAFAGWTSEALDLDATLLPVFEQHFGVQPPRSFTGRDEPPLDDVARAAVDAEKAGDLPAAAVLWKQVQARRPEDPAAAAALQRLLAMLGDTPR
jgi:hypothetical protein